MSGKRERATKFHVSGKDGMDHMVTLAADDKDAAHRWAKRKGRNAKDAVVTPLGTRVASMRHGADPHAAAPAKEEKAAAGLKNK